MSCLAGKGTIKGELEVAAGYGVRAEANTFATYQLHQHFTKRGLLAVIRDSRRLPVRQRVHLQRRCEHGVWFLARRLQRSMQR